MHPATVKFELWRKQKKIAGKLGGGGRDLKMAKFTPLFPILQ